MKFFITIAFCLCPCATGALAQEGATALLVGSVRDQSGAPIAGAHITARDEGGNTIAGDRTDEQGTFSLRTSGVASIAITCSYCQRETISAPQSPVVAIVHRYLALEQQSPSAEDIAALPYAHIEEAAALHPFTVLQDSKALLPSVQLSDRGLQSGRGLLLDTGVPSYDIVTGLTPFSAFPARDAQTVQVIPATDAFLYGDQAGGGSFEIDTVDANDQNSITVGNDSAARVAPSHASAKGVLAVSQDAWQDRQRAEIAANTMVDDTQVHFAGAASINDTRDDSGATSVSGYDFTRISLQRTTDYRMSSALFIDRGFYRSNFERSRVADTWTDLGAEAEAQSLGPTIRFGGFSMRESSGYDETYNSRVPDVAAHLSQRHAYIGIHAGRPALQGIATLSAFYAAYNGGPTGFPSVQTALLPSVKLSASPNERWNLQLTGADTFRLPTFLEKAAVPSLRDFYNRSRLWESSVSYTDLSRFRAKLTSFSERTRGLSASNSWGLGASLSWQLAPALSVRAWILHFNRLEQYDMVSAQPRAMNVSSVWLTYQLNSELRADLLYRRNLLDFTPDAHLDAAVSGPLQHGLRWRLSTERRRMVRYVDFGITSIR